MSSSGSEKSQSEKSLSSYEIQSKSKISSFGLNFKPKKLLKSVTKGKVRILWVVAIWGYSHRFGGHSKGQLISKCPFGVLKSSKKPTKIFQDFCPSL